MGRAFVGYRKLPGSSLWSEEFAQISDEGTIDRLATDVASFLQTLHATPLDSISMPLGPPDSQAGWQDMFSRIREVVYPHLTAEARRWTTERFAAFLEDDEHFAFSKVLRHGDFGTSNTLYSSEQRRVVGIIDFGHAGVGDAAIDFAGLCVSYGEPFLKRCARVYPLIDQCWERIRFYAVAPFCWRMRCSASRTTWTKQKKSSTKSTRSPSPVAGMALASFQWSEVNNQTDCRGFTGQRGFTDQWCFGRLLALVCSR